MIYCLNPECKQPVNVTDADQCATCAAPLTALLRGRYRIQRQLGRGGFGKTFLAIDEDRLQAKCVIKQFSPQIKGTEAMEKAVRLFEQEARRLDELGEHPQIPTLLAYFEHEQRLYLVQQFVEGQTLVQELAEYGSFDEQKIREVLVGLLPILKFVHDRNVIHRDITPSNIIRRQGDNKLVLIDFGVAKLFNENTFGIPGTKIGTEGYAPIEQLRNGKAYPASDIYSLGVTSLYLLTQTKPEDLYDPLRGRWQWREKLEETGVAISPGIGAILDVMVQDLVIERYQSAIAAVQDLKAALQHPPLGLPAGAPVPNPPTLPPSRPVPMRSGQPQPGQTGQPRSGQPQFPMSQPVSQQPVSQQPVSQQPISAPVSTQIQTGKDPIAAAQSAAKPSAAKPNVPITSQPNSGIRPPYSGQVIARPTGQPAIGQPTTGQPVTGQPVTGQPTTGQPTTGQPVTGQAVTRSLDNPYDSSNPMQYPCLATLKGHSSWVLAVAISPDSRYLVSGGLDDRLIVWDITKGQQRFVINDAHSKPINALAISPDGQFFVSASDDDTMKVWQLATGQLVRVISGHTQDVNAVSITPDGQFIVSGSEDRSVAVWRLATGDRLRNFPEVTGLIKATAISANGEFVVSGGSDSSIKIWNLNAGNLIQTLKGHLNAIQSVAISSEGRFVVSGSKDRTIRIWILKTGEAVRTLLKHLEPVNAVAITPDSRFIISGSADKTVRIWRLPTGELVATLAKHTGAVNAIAISPNQRWFATAGSDGQICVWQLTPMN
jgi:serine/threonine protein kinase